VLLVQSTLQLVTHLLNRFGADFAAVQRGGFFCYSAEEPPRKRALVLVDAVDASIVEQLVEANPDKV